VTSTGCTQLTTAVTSWTAITGAALAAFDAVLTQNNLKPFAVTGRRSSCRVVRGREAAAPGPAFSPDRRAGPTRSARYASGPPAPRARPARCTRSLRRQQQSDHARVGDRARRETAEQHRRRSPGSRPRRRASPSRASNPVSVRPGAATRARMFPRVAPRAARTADLARPLRDVAGQHAVHTGGRQHQGASGRTPRQHQREAGSAAVAASSPPSWRLARSAWSLSTDQTARRTAARARRQRRVLSPRSDIGLSPKCH